MQGATQNISFELNAQKTVQSSQKQLFRNPKISIFYDRNPFEVDADDGAFYGFVMSFKTGQYTPSLHLPFVGS